MPIGLDFGHKAEFLERFVIFVWSVIFLDLLRNLNQGVVLTSHGNAFHLLFGWVQLLHGSLRVNLILAVGLSLCVFVGGWMLE